MLNHRVRIGKRKKPADVRLQVIENARHKLIVLRKGLSASSPEDNAIQFFHIVKKFFSAFFSIPYNLSYEEIEKSVSGKIKDEKLRGGVVSFLNSVSLMEFSGIAPQEKQISYFSMKFISLLSLIEKSETHNSEESSLRKGIKIIQDRLGITEEMKKAEAESIERIYHLLLLGHKSISAGELSNAKDIYTQIRQIYNKLSQEGKQKLYSEILYFYRKINERKE